MARRGRILVLVLMVLVAVVAVSVVVPGVRENLPGTARPRGTWGSYLRLDLPTGWGVITRTLTPEAETVTVEDRRSMAAGECRVTVWSAGVTPPESTSTAAARTTPVRVDGRGGRLVVTSRTATLRWRYARAAQAETSCDTVGGRDATLVREIAGAWLTIAPEYRALPFTFDGRPPRAPVGLVAFDERGIDGRPPLPTLQLEAVAPPGGWSLSLGMVGEVPATGPTRTRSGANGLAVRVAEDGTQGCLAPAPRICAQAFWNGDALPPRGAAISTALVVGLLGGVRLADRVDDPATWFDLDSALG